MQLLAIGQNKVAKLIKNNHRNSIVSGISIRPKSVYDDCLRERTCIQFSPDSQKFASYCHESFGYAASRRSLTFVVYKFLLGSFHFIARITSEILYIFQCLYIFSGIVSYIVDCMNIELKVLLPKTQCSIRLSQYGRYLRYFII